jgi:hypothetical protein
VTLRYAASEIISIFDASLLWFDKNPNELPWYPGDGGWIVVLKRDQEVFDLTCMLLWEIEQKLIKVQKRSWLRNIAESWKSDLESLPGKLDPRGTKVEIGELVEFAKRHNQKPDFLAHLIPPAATQTENQQPSKALMQRGAPKRRRGPKVRKRDQVRERMRQEIRDGGLTIEHLKNALEKTLADKYGVSRDTARKARAEVLAEFVEN